MMKSQSHPPLSVHELAQLSGVSVRTLHYYDHIGLLPPQGKTSAGYRQYGEAELARLQQILLYREMGLPLKKIRELLQQPDFDVTAALREQQAGSVQTEDTSGGAVS